MIKMSSSIAIDFPIFKFEILQGIVKRTDKSYTRRVILTIVLQSIYLIILGSKS